MFFAHISDVTAPNQCVWLSCLLASLMLVGNYVRWSVTYVSLHYCRCYLKRDFLLLLFIIN